MSKFTNRITEAEFIRNLAIQGHPFDVIRQFVICYRFVADEDIDHQEYLGDKWAQFEQYMYDLMNYDKGDPRHLRLIDFILNNKIDPDEGALYSSTLKVDHIQKIIQEVKDQLKDGIKLEPKRVDPNEEPEKK
nr:hypothetical protein [Lachnospiraceae bacterium]